MAAAAITLAATAARADPPRVALEHEGMAAATEARLRAELLGLGFEVVDARRGPGEGARDAARRTGAVAVVREVPSGMEIWVRSGLTILEPGRGADDATMALRTVEVVRASLLDVRPAPRRGRRRPPPAREAPSRSSRRGCRRPRAAPPSGPRSSARGCASRRGSAIAGCQARRSASPRRG